MKLYHYAPKISNIQEEGLTSPFVQLLSPSFKISKSIYAKRASDYLNKNLDKLCAQDIIDYLEKIRGTGGSKMLSFLTEKIPKNAYDKLKNYAESRSLYSVETEELIKNKIIEAVYIVEEKPKSQRYIPIIENVDYELSQIRINDWKEDNGFLFSKRPHVFLTTRYGVISPRFLCNE